jgi:hypothetical protein
MHYNFIHEASGAESLSGIMEKTVSKSEHQDILFDTVIDEIAYALGAKKDGVIRHLLAPLLRNPATKLAKILAEFYDKVVNKSPSQGAIDTLPKFNVEVQRSGHPAMPMSGSHLLISNHPGGLDSVGILSCIPRADIKVLVSDVLLMRKLDYLNRYAIFVDFKTVGGMSALRDAISHLNQGGVLLLFARGEVEPDPACFPGAVESIEKWSPSLEIMLRKSPLTTVQILSVSGAILPRFAFHPLTRLRKRQETRQKLAEFMQAITSLYYPKKVQTILKIRFSEIIRSDRIPREAILPYIIKMAQTEMKTHISTIGK